MSNDNFGDLEMLEKWLGEIVAGLLAIIMAFFWRNQTRVETSLKNAHDRITEQAEVNNDKFARRDDMKAVEERLISTMNAGFESVKKDIRAMKSNND